MKISGRSIAYLIILLVVFIGGATVVRSQGLAYGLVPHPVEENLVVEPFQYSKTITFSFWRGNPCNANSSKFLFEVPGGKRLIIEDVSGQVRWGNEGSTSGFTQMRLQLNTDGTDIVTPSFFSAFRIPSSDGRQMTAYAGPYSYVNLLISCEPARSNFRAFVSIIGRLVDYPYPVPLCPPCEEPDP